MLDRHDDAVGKAVCRAVERRLVRQQDDPLWLDLIGALGNDPQTYPSFGGDVQFAPSEDGPLVVLIVSATQESTLSYSVAPDGRITGPEFVYGGGIEGPPSGQPPDLQEAVQIMARRSRQRASRSS